MAICKTSDIENIASIRRVVDDNNVIYDKVEFTFNKPAVPRNIRLGDFIIAITPTIPHPRRCYRYQRFYHTMDQCRSTYPSYEHCAGRHSIVDCPKGEHNPTCKNCEGDHAASSSSCPIFKLEFGILRHRFTTNCDREKAKLPFYAENPDLYNEVEARPDSSFGDNPRENPNLTRNLPAPKTGHFTLREGSPVSPSGMNEEVEIATDPTSPDDVSEQDPYYPLHSVDSLIKLNQDKSDIIGFMQKRLNKPPPK